MELSPELKRTQRVADHLFPCSKSKGKFHHPTTDHEGPEGEYMYVSTLSLTSALDGVGGQRYDPAAFTLGKTRYPLYRWIGGPQCRCHTSPGFDLRTV
jgi:hypothetical protein